MSNRRLSGGDLYETVAKAIADIPLTDLIWLGNWHIGTRPATAPFQFHVMEGSAFRGQYRERTSAVLLVLDMDKRLTLADLRHGAE